MSLLIAHNIIMIQDPQVREIRGQTFYIDHNYSLDKSNV